MVSRRILIIQGHPDAGTRHLGHALADAYAAGAEAAGHAVRRITVAELDFPLVRSQVAWERGEVPTAIRAAQEAVRWADHLVILYPLWLGTLPALLKGFFEQLFRPDFAFGEAADGDRPGRHLKGRSARIVVTMGMPAFLYRWYFRAHSLRSFERNVLRFCGIGPVRETLFGVVDAGGGRQARWLRAMARLGKKGR